MPFSKQVQAMVSATSYIDPLATDLVMPETTTTTTSTTTSTTTT
jgi:hypothetical protein